MARSEVEDKVSAENSRIKATPGHSLRLNVVMKVVQTIITCAACSLYVLSVLAKTNNVKLDTINARMFTRQHKTLVSHLLHKYRFRGQRANSI